MFQEGNWKVRKTRIVYISLKNVSSYFGVTADEAVKQKSLPYSSMTADETVKGKTNRFLYFMSAERSLSSII